MIVFAVFSGSPVFANVVINEIAWMGTNNSANDEWIELYNSGTSTVDLTGWKLTNADASIQITITGTLGAGSYGLLERTDDTTVPNVTALTMYVGAMSNTGEVLTLKDVNGTTVDTLDNSSGWVKGDNTTKQTMQKSGSNWITADATPGAVNIGSDSTPTNTGGNSSNSTTTSSSSSSKSNDDDEKVVIPKDPKYSITMNIPETIMVGTPIKITSVIKVNNSYETMVGKFEYSTGDGQFFTWTQNKPVEHTYLHAGNYIFQLKYYESIFSISPNVIVRKTITVVPDTISINSLLSGVLEIKNNSTDTIDLAGFTIQSVQSPVNKFTFPETLILQGASIFLNPQRLGFYIHKKSDISIRNASGTIISQSSVLSTSNTRVQTFPVNPYDSIPAYENPNYLHETLVTHNDDNPKTGLVHDTIMDQLKTISKKISMMIVGGSSQVVIIALFVCLILGLFGYGEYRIYKLEQKNKQDDEIDTIDYPDSENSNIVL